MEGRVAVGEALLWRRSSSTPDGGPVLLAAAPDQHGGAKGGFSTATSEKIHGIWRRKTTNVGADFLAASHR